jgi:hypothetical protein
MNDEDLTDLFAGLAMMGMLAAGRKNVEHEAYRIADAMVEAKYANPEPEEGITAIKPRRKRSVDVPTPNDTTRHN